MILKTKTCFEFIFLENIEKCNDAESSCAKNEEGRRAGEARSFAAEQGLEAMEAELEEAQSIATASNHKFEDAQRKCKVVEGDLERVIERAEEFEGKARDLETQVREMESKVKETEAITVKNAEEEDKYETKIARLQEEFKLADTRAEFAERSVDKEGFEVGFRSPSTTSYSVRLSTTKSYLGALVLTELFRIQTD